jgi:hypothetical protein
MMGIPFCIRYLIHTLPELSSSEKLARLRLSSSGILTMPKQSSSEVLTRSGMLFCERQNTPGLSCPLLEFTSNISSQLPGSTMMKGFTETSTSHDTIITESSNIVLADDNFLRQYTLLFETFMRIIGPTDRMTTEYIDLTDQHIHALTQRSLYSNNTPNRTPQVSEDEDEDEDEENVEK